MKRILFYILFLTFCIISGLSDGFAYAGEALAGRFIGAKNKPMLHHMIKRIFFWGLMVSLVAVVVYTFFPDLILRLLTNDIAIIEETKNFMFWTVLIPLTGFAAFLWDGIFIGATASAEMRNAMILASVIFFLSYFLLTPMWGNNALWLSFIIYLAARGIALTYMARKTFSYK